MTGIFMVLLWLAGVAIASLWLYAVIRFAIIHALRARDEEVRTRTLYGDSTPALAHNDQEPPQPQPYS